MLSYIGPLFVNTNAPELVVILPLAVTVLMYVQSTIDLQWMFMRFSAVLDVLGTRSKT